MADTVNYIWPYGRMADTANHILLQLQTAPQTNLQTLKHTVSFSFRLHAQWGPYHEDHIPDGGDLLSMHELLQDLPS